jgi:hypothetical protein
MLPSTLLMRAKSFWVGYYTRGYAVDRNLITFKIISKTLCRYVHGSTAHEVAACRFGAGKSSALSGGYLACVYRRNNCYKYADKKVMALSVSQGLDHWQQLQVDGRPRDTFPCQQQHFSRSLSASVNSARILNGRCSSKMHYSHV